MNHAALDTLHADVARAARGDREAFGRLVSATSGLVTAITAGEARDLEASRDAAQEAYLHAWRDLPTLRNPGSFLPWLRELARRRARESRPGRERLVTGAAAEEALAAAADAAPDAADRLLRAEERRAVAEALDALPDDARETVVLFYREGRSAAQVAQLLGLSEAAVWQRLTRARAALREDLLARAGELFERTAPGVAFTATVLGALGTTAPVAAGAATAAGLAAKGTAGAAGLASVVVGGAGALASLAMGRETRFLLDLAEDEPQRAAVRRHGRISQVCLALFAVVLPVVATLAHVRWLSALGFGLYALSLVAVQRVALPAAMRRRAAQRPWGREVLAAGLVLGAAVSVACLVLAWRWYGG